MGIISLIGFAFLILPFILYFFDFKRKRTVIAVGAVIGYFSMVIALKIILTAYPISWTLFILVIPMLFLIKAIVQPNKPNKNIPEDKNSELLDD